MKNSPFSPYIIVLLIAASLPAFIPRAHADEATDNLAVIPVLTAASWRVSGDTAKWTRMRLFDRNGTFTSPGSPKEHGRWKIANGFVILTFADKHEDTMALPLDPTGTKGTDSSGAPITYVQVKNPADVKN